MLNKHKFLFLFVLNDCVWPNLLREPGDMSKYDFFCQDSHDSVILQIKLVKTACFSWHHFIWLYSAHPQSIVKLEVSSLDTHNSCSVFPYLGIFHSQPHFIMHKRERERSFYGSWFSYNLEGHKYRIKLFPKTPWKRAENQVYLSPCTDLFQMDVRVLQVKLLY